MPETPNWLGQILQEDRAFQLFRRACKARQELADCVEAVRAIVKQPKTETLGVTEEALIEESTIYLDSFSTKGLWYKCRQIGRLERLIADLTQHTDALAKVALPHLDTFVEQAFERCKVTDRALSDLHAKGHDDAWWRGSQAMLGIVDVLIEGRCTPTRERNAMTVLEAYAAFQEIGKLLEGIQRVEEQDSRQREAHKLLAQLQNDYRARKYRLAVQRERLSHFKQACVSWQDIQLLLNQADELLATATTGLANLEALVAQGEADAVLSLGAGLQASLVKIQSLCDQSGQTRASRRKQLQQAADTATNQLRRARRVTQGYGKPENNPGLQCIRAFVQMYRQALSDHGSMLTVEAIVEQAQEITRAVDNLATEPTESVTVKVQKEFDELGCFPE